VAPDQPLDAAAHRPANLGVGGGNHITSDANVTSWIKENNLVDEGDPRHGDAARGVEQPGAGGVSRPEPRRAQPMAGERLREGLGRYPDGSRLHAELAPRKEYIQSRVDVGPFQIGLVAQHHAGVELPIASPLPAGGPARSGERVAAQRTKKNDLLVAGS